MQRRVVGMERQRDEGLEAVGFVLQLAQPQQVIHAVLFGLDVAVEHGAVGVQPHLMRDARHLHPLLAGDLVIADDAPHAIVRKFRRRRRASNPCRRPSGARAPRDG